MSYGSFSLVGREIVAGSALAAVVEVVEDFGGSVADYVHAPRFSAREWVLLPLSESGAASGAEAVFEANFRALSAEFGAAVSEVGLGYSLGLGFEVDAVLSDEVYGQLVEVLGFFAEGGYPLWDESVHADVVDEWEGRAWEDFARDDVRAAVVAAAGAEVAAGISDDELDAVFFDYQSNGGEVYLEGDSLVFDVEDVAAAVVAAFEGGEINV